MTGLPLKLAVLLSLYMAQGLPTGIYNQALPAILRSHGVSLTAIGLTSLLALPWATKVFWAPFVDRWHHPGLGRARSWIIPLQCLCVGVVLVIAGFEAGTLRTTPGLLEFFLLMFLLNLLAATQDIATDGLAVRTLSPGQRSKGNSVQVVGYRIGLIIGGGLLLFLLGVWRWDHAFLLLAGLLLLLTIPILWLSGAGAVASSKPSEGRLGYLETFLSFSRAPGFAVWLGVLLSYKVADGFGSAMVKPMLVDMGFDLKQLGLQVTILGSLGTIAGAVAGGWLTVRWGRYPALLAFGLMQALGLGAYAVLSMGWEAGQAVHPWAVYGINILEHVASGLATVALLTVIMDHCRHHHAGSDFTFQVSVLAVTGGLAHLAAGVVADLTGYTAYFLLAMGIGVALLAPVVHWGRQTARRPIGTV